jgi:hypothetical protein
MLLTPAFMAVGPVAPAADKAAATLPELADLLAKMQEAANRQSLELCSYSVVQTYNLQNKHLNPSAQMQVRLTYVKGEGKHFQILSMHAEGIARRSLENLVKEETRTSSSSTRNVNAVDSANYRFRLLGKETCGNQDCYQLAITARHKRKDLVDGTAWVRADDYHLAKVAGRLAKSPSFWVSRPKIEQHFEEVDGFSVPSYNHSTTEILFLGEADLTIEYADYRMHACKADSGHKIP